MLKKCPKCKETKSIDQYNKKTRGKLQSRCRKCQNAEVRVHYAENKDYYKKKARKYGKKLAMKVWVYKEQTPCTDCNQIYPHYVMDFDHRDPETKDFVLAHAQFKGSWRKIEKEMEKCDLVCANCHRERTHQRRLLAFV